MGWPHSTPNMLYAHSLKATVKITAVGTNVSIFNDWTLQIPYINFFFFRFGWGEYEYELVPQKATFGGVFKAITW